MTQKWYTTKFVIANKTKIVANNIQLHSDWLQMTRFLIVVASSSWNNPSGMVEPIIFIFIFCYWRTKILWNVHQTSHICQLLFFLLKDWSNNILSTYHYILHQYVFKFTLCFIRFLMKLVKFIMVKVNNPLIYMDKLLWTCEFINS